MMNPVKYRSIFLLRPIHNQRRKPNMYSQIRSRYAYRLYNSTDKRHSAHLCDPLRIRCYR